ncbi:MAG: excinuclease ABC subunit UvrC [Nocardioidaceae bacterium]
MADPATYRPAPGAIPESPGVYRFRDERGRVIYVGKAKSLRPRLSSYFQDLANLHSRTRTMVTTAASVDWTVVSTEVEALQLEYTWIKEFDPRYNVKYRDDKSYPWLAVTLNEEFPRVMVGRGPKRKGARYFGPYSHAWAIRETVDLLLRVFPMRSCSSGVFKRSQQIGRPCLLGYIGKCSAPCVDRVSAEEHRDIVEDFCNFLAGQTAPYVRRLERQMQKSAAAMDYERAARLRDDIGALNRALEKNAVVLGDGTDADVVALAEDPLEVAVQIFSVRTGRIRGQRGWVADKTDDAGSGDLVERALVKLYDGETAEAIPREVLVPALPADAAALAAWLAARRGGHVDLRVPLRGDKRALMETVARNAKQSLATHKTRRASDLTTRSRALEEIQLALGLDDAPLRVECFDVSNLQGTEVVASMVVFEDGLPRKSDYRRFVIRGVDGQNDVASIHETILRRFRRMHEDQEAEVRDPDTGRPRRFAYTPGLVVVDGGPPQVAAAAQAMAEAGVPDVAVCGLAKRLEEVWLPGEDDPVILPRTSEGLYLLQRMRDEAHRFAISHHRDRRSKSMVASALDDVPGLGDVRRKALLKQFGSLKKLRSATVQQIGSVPGIGPATAESVVTALAAGSALASAAAPGEGLVALPPGGVNVATGELHDDPPALPQTTERPEVT